MYNKPNILFIVTDQQRFDTISALGNEKIYTPNLDWLVKRGISFTNMYSVCPVCVPARYNIRTGRDPLTTTVFENIAPIPLSTQSENMEERCGDYLPRVMSKLGYRTFGIGKFHTMPAWDEELGYDVHLHTEELFANPDQRSRDAFASFIAKEHPEYNFIEQLHGERTNMYYIPQMSPLPIELTVESFVTDKAIEQINSSDKRPYFGFVSFIGPHPPCAPPIPYNRMYNPDNMPNPVKGNIKIDYMDEQIPWMNHFIWAEDINDSLARNIKSRYYGEISYIDNCIGRILDAIKSNPDADNTLICFFSDHGDHLGNHHAWQKESFFEDSCKVPFLLSWPRQIAKNQKCDKLVSLTDLFGVATAAAGQIQIRDGIDVLGMLKGESKARNYLFGCYGKPGTPDFKIMVRDNKWKYIFMSNGGYQQLFDIPKDPYELSNKIKTESKTAEKLRSIAIEKLEKSEWSNRVIKDGDLRSFEFTKKPPKRVYQFDWSKGIKSFPKKPADLVG